MPEHAELRGAHTTIAQLNKPIEARLLVKQALRQLSASVHHQAWRERIGRAARGRAAHLLSHHGERIAELVEVENGKRWDRPELDRHGEEAPRSPDHRQAGRLSRNVAFIATLMERRVDFLAVDNP